MDMARNLSSPSALRGQAAIEVLVYMGFFMLVFVSLSVMFLSQIGQDVVQREYRLSQSVSAQIADDVNTAQLAGPGFNATFPVPRQISGRNYSLNFSDRGVLSVQLAPTRPDWPPTVFTFPLSTRNLRLGCNGAGNPACPGNGMVTQAYGGVLRTSWWVDTTDGTLQVANVGNETGSVLLEVS
ncbi:Uncharacterised protein [uncultured archaeon]|nr:Uncharacterised protein [uncultured archaeon]